MKTVTCHRLIKLDIDDLPDRFYEVQKILHALKPCFVRVSSSKRGLHILKKCDKIEKCEDLGIGKGCDWILEMWDDPKRRKINKIREKHGLNSDILFDIKSFRNFRRIAGEWQVNGDSYDSERIIDYWRV